MTKTNEHIFSHLLTISCVQTVYIPLYGRNNIRNSIQYFLHLVLFSLCAFLGAVFALSVLFTCICCTLCVFVVLGVFVVILCVFVVLYVYLL